MDEAKFVWVSINEGWELATVIRREGGSFVVKMEDGKEVCRAGSVCVTF